MRKSSTLICAPIMAESVANMVVDIGRAKAVGAGFVEIRLVHLKVFNSNEERNPLCSLFSLIRELKGSIWEFCDTRIGSWNAMLFSFGLHGKAIQSLQVFEQMVVNQVKPDNVTFIFLLMACIHSGLIGGKVTYFLKQCKQFMVSLLRKIMWHAWWICLLEVDTWLKQRNGLIGIVQYMRRPARVKLYLEHVLHMGSWDLENRCMGETL